MTRNRTPALLVGLATVVLYGVLVVWACVTPAFRAPDEPQQVSTTLRLAYVHSYPAAGAARIYPPVKASYHDVGFGGIGLNTINGIVPLARPAADQLTSQTMRRLGATSAGTDSPYDYDQMTQHPPGYFALLGGFARVFDVIDKTPHTALLILRLCSALMLLPLPWLVYRIGLALRLAPLGAGSAAFLPVGLPQLTHIGAAVSNDTLTVTLAAAVTWLSLEVVRRERGRPWAVALGLVTTGLLLTKGIALPMLIVVAVAFAMRAHRFGVRRVVADTAVALGCMLPGLAWWVANVVRYGTLQPDGYPQSYLDKLPHGTIALGTWLHGFFPALTRSFFADFGWLEAPPPTAVVVAATVGLLGLVAVGIVRARRAWPLAVLAQLSWVMPLVAIMDTSHAASNRIGALQGVQGRYLFSGVAAIAVAVALAVRPATGGRAGLVGRSGVDGEGPAWGFAALPPFAMAVAVLGLAAGVSHFYLGDGFSGELGTFSAWSPLRLRVLAAVLALCIAATLLAVVLLLLRPAAPTSLAVIKQESTRHADVADGFVLDHREVGGGDGGSAPA